MSHHGISNILGAQGKFQMAEILMKKCMENGTILAKYCSEPA